MGLIITDISSEEQDFYKKQYLNAGDLRDNISKLEEEEPTDKRKLAYKEWENKINYLYKLYNAKVGWKAYKVKGDAVRKRIRKKKDT